MRLNRYLTHVVMLLIATVLSGYSVSLGWNLGHGPINAEAVSAGGTLGGVSLGRDVTIIQPVAIPISAPTARRTAILYTVKPGDTLDSVTSTLGIPFRHITGSNPGLRLPLRPGLVLRIPPVPGIVVIVRAGDSPASLALAYGVDPASIIDLNRIRGQLAPGSMLVIPINSQPDPDLSADVLVDPIAPGQLLCPIQGAKIIQKFGPTSFALEPPYDGYLHFHTGVDVLAEYDTAIVAAAGGMVTAAGPSGDFGIRVEITDIYGLVEIYAHMSQVSGVTVGQRVRQGQKIGLVGSTGFSIGSHLHLQLEVGGKPADPLPLVGC